MANACWSFHFKNNAGALKIIIIIIIIIIKNSRGLKNYFIFDLHNPSFYIKEHLPKQQSKIRIF